MNTPATDGGADPVDPVEARLGPTGDVAVGDEGSRTGGVARPGPDGVRIDRGAWDPAALPLEIDRSSGTPLYLQLAGGIDAAIRSGRLQPGSRLENELDLARRLGLSRPTVRQGIQALVDKGMLVRKRGVGTQVVESPVSRKVALTSLHDDLQGAGRAPRTEVLEYRVGRPSPEAADRLLLSPGEQVLDLVRVRFADDEPLAVMRNTLPERVAPSREDLRERGLYECLRARGVALAVAHERIGAAVADAEHAELLDEEVGAALLTMDRKVFGNDGGVIEYGHHVYRASRYTFEVTLVE